jgi:diamine N-acetyltransferase
MPGEVRLEPVSAKNWDEVAKLELRDDQRDYVASNADSLAEARRTPLARPRAIYAGNVLVGFLMYEPLVSEGKPNEAALYRFMIDKKHQGKGYGRSAIERALAEIRQIPGITKVSTCYMAENPVTKQFYASFGFVEVEHDEDGEIIAELVLTKSQT